MRLLFIFVVRLLLLAAFTFGFVVLFEHGPEKFSEGARTEWNALLFFVGSVLSREESVPARAKDQPATPPPPAGASSPAQKPAQTRAVTNQPASGTPAPNR